MNRLLVGPDVWDEIRRTAHRSRSLTAMVGYVGRRPDQLMRWPRGSRLLVDLSEEAVRGGFSSARGALRLLRHGVTVYRVKNLHAKVYLFDRSAVVCSANLSSDSANVLLEAGVKVTQDQMLEAIGKRIQAVIRVAVIMDAKLLRALARLEPKRVPRRGEAVRVGKGALPFLDGRPIWLLTCRPDEEEEPAVEQRQKSRLENRLEEEHLLDGRVLEWLNACGLDVKRAVKESDWLFFWWEANRQSKFGQLEGPYESLRPFDLGRRLGERRYCLAMLSRQRRRVHIDREVMDKLFRILALTRPKRWPKRREFAWDKAGAKPRKVPVRNAARLAKILFE